jgi:hypothetical protein
MCTYFNGDMIVTKLTGYAKNQHTVYEDSRGKKLASMDSKSMFTQIATHKH